MSETRDEYGAEVTQDDPFPGTPPEGDENPGDYEPMDPGGQSEETGVTYDAFGEPESTPHDEALEAESLDDGELETGANAATSAGAEDDTPPT